MSATATSKAELLVRDVKYLSEKRLKKAVSKQSSEAIVGRAASL
jgi:hypothetical protein